MAGTSMTAALQQVSRLFREGTFQALPDDQLLDRFLDQDDEDAFAALVARHGPMVLGACLDVLRDPADAEDAFQATFLTLVRRARSIRGRDYVGGWLRRVARRSALEVNAGRLRRSRREQLAVARAGSASGPGVAESLDRQELNQVINAEIKRLPEQYRRPVVLCLVEGLPQLEVAGRLCVSEGVIRGRLARGRALLRERLTRQGVGPGQSSHAGAPIVPAAWVGSILAAARVLKAGRAARVGWSGLRISVPAGLLVMIGTLCVATASLHALPTPPVRSLAPRPQARATALPIAVKPAEGPGRTIVMRGKVFDLEGRPVAGARLWLVTDPWASAAEHGTSDAEGSYRIALPEATFRRNFTPSITSPRVQIALIATAKGLGAGWKQLESGTFDGKPAMQPEYAQDLHLSADRPIEGRLIDPNGKPVAGAIVQVRTIRIADGGDWKPILDGLRKLEPDQFRSGFSYVHPYSSWTRILATTSDADGRFRLAGVGRDRMIDLIVTGPGILPVELSVMTVADVADIARAMRDKYPRARDSNGNFLPSYGTPNGIPPAVMLFDAAPTVEVQRGQTVSGVVRNARTGEPIPKMSLSISSRSGGSAQMNADDQGRYRGARGDREASIWVYATSYQPELYLSAVRQFDDAKAPGEIVSDFDIEPGVLVTGRVLEAGTGRPIVSAPRDACHDQGHIVAGRVEYFPLATNTALRATPTGLYFAGPTLGQNLSTSTWIEGDGRFRLAVPPGPGVLLIKADPGLPMFSHISTVWKGSDGLEQLFPYAPLTARAKDDGAPGDDPKTFPGFTAPIPVSGYHAYQLIDPPADAQSLSVELSVPRAPSRLLRFVDPAGHPIRGVTIAGLLPSPSALEFRTFPRFPMTSLDGSEAEALALDPLRPRSLLAISHDGFYFARDVLDSTGPLPLPPRTIAFEPASSLAGRLLDAATGGPLAGATVGIAYQGDEENRIPRPFLPATTDAEGRFLIRGLIPDLRVSVSIQQPLTPELPIGSSPVHRPESLQGVTLRARETRDFGDIQIPIKK